MASYYNAAASTRSDGFVEIRIGFGDPASNVEIVPAALAAMKELGLTGGKGVLFNGAASLPVAMALAHAVAHLFEVVACWDPKLSGYVVAISHGREHRPGDLISG